jgi:hypothetical protein
MKILEIESVSVNGDEVNVSAIVDEAIITFSQTYFEPAEYGPALCEASFSLNEDELLPEDEEELISFLEKIYLEWKVVDNSDYYLD